jgi:hypothetical protein
MVLRLKIRWGNKFYINAVFSGYKQIWQVKQLPDLRVIMLKDAYVYAKFSGR